VGPRRVGHGEKRAVEVGVIICQRDLCGASKFECQIFFFFEFECQIHSDGIKS